MENFQQMETMHKMCQEEFHKLRQNMERFLQDSEHIQKLLNKRPKNALTADGSVNNLFALITFDRYLSQISTVTNMARKLNIHMEINALPRTVLNAMGSLESVAFGASGVGSCTTKSRVLQDLIQWSSCWMGREFEEESFKNNLSTLNCFTPIILDDSNNQTERKAIESQEHMRTIGSSTKEVIRKSTLKKVFNFSNLDEYLCKLLPSKNLSHLKDGHIFSASVTHVEDSAKLRFFICEMSDYSTLFEITTPPDLIPIQRSALSDQIFWVLQETVKEESQNKCVWRAILVPKEFSSHQNSVLLIDFGEIIPLTEKCKLFKMCPKFVETPPLAIKCVLRGVCDSEGLLSTDKQKCQTVLLLNQFKMATFQIVGKESRVLQLILLESKSNEISPLTLAPQESATRNPFIDSMLLEDQSESDENIDPMPLPLSAVYGSQSLLKSDFNIKVGDNLLATVTHVINPIMFFGVIEDKLKTDSCEDLFWSDEEISPAQKQILPKPNDIVLAQYIKDDHWYRARIIKIMPEGNFYMIYYIDFGNTEIVPISCLASCNIQQRKCPSQAILFRVDGLKLVYSEDEKVAKSKLQKALETIVVIILNQTINLEVVDQYHNESNYEEIIVRFTDDQYSHIPAMILKMGVVTKM